MADWMEAGFNVWLGGGGTQSVAGKGGTQWMAGWRLDSMCGWLEVELKVWLVKVELNVWLDEDGDQCVAWRKHSSMCDWVEVKLSVSLDGKEDHCVIGWRRSSLWLGEGGDQCVAQSGAGYTVGGPQCVWNLKIKLLVQYFSMAHTVKKFTILNKRSFKNRNELYACVLCFPI